MKRCRSRGRITGFIGMAILAINVIGVVFAPAIAQHEPSDLIGDVWAPPTADAWLGLDNLGRDMLARLLYGGRTSMGLAATSTLLAFGIGVVGGFTAAIAPRWVDLLLSRLVDVLMAMPQLIIALIVLSVLGTSIPVLIGTIAILTSTRVFRVSRAIGIGIVVMDYVESAKLRGEGLGWIIAREMLPNALPPLLAEFGVRFCYTLLFISSLSFLGLGVQPPNADWGSMVRDNAMVINFGGFSPLIPAAAIALLTVGVNLIVDWFVAIYVQAHGEGT
jgi:peptide/nickel transport system permease protein